MTSLGARAGAEQDLDAFADTVRDRFGEVFEREPVADRAAPSSGSSRRRRYARARTVTRDRRAHPRHPLARQPGGTAPIEGTVPFRARKPPWLKVPAPGRADLPPAQEGDRGRQPAHRLRGGQLPERRRVLGARHRDLHDPRRRLHPALRLLQRADRRADLERPARAAAGREPGEADGPAPRRGHLGRPRRPARLRRRAPSSA